jgi:hypothetical protein
MEEPRPGVVEHLSRRRGVDHISRTLIGHSIEGSAEQVARFYHPALRMDERPLELAISQGGGSCGVWVERDGRQVVEMTGQERMARKHEQFSDDTDSTQSLLYDRVQSALGV